MNLKEMLKNIAKIDIADNRQVEGLTHDSRKIKKNFLFVAIKGLKNDGHIYLKEAREKGASAALVQGVNKDIDLLQIKTADTRKALAQAALNFYKYPSSSFNLIGITGTNGKTTTAFMLESIFKTSNQKTGLIGTINYRIGEKSYSLEHTTPESVDLQRIFSEMSKIGVETAIIEVSSHACALHRIDGSDFNQAIFTNLTQDHLDYHKNLENYFKAKKRLFDCNEKAVHIINIDDPFSKRLLKRNHNILTYGLAQGADFRASNIVQEGLSSRFVVNFKGHSFNFEIMLGGLFNIYNALAAITSSINLGIEPEAVQHGLFNLRAVPGRFERLFIDEPYEVIVDFAHTPDGLEKVLKTAKSLCEGRLITVFGCGGERDKGKRRKMGKIASNLSDVVIVTSDNPRNEDPEEIINQITEGESCFITEADRRKAIEMALKIAKENDLVVLAGKGHETTQEVAGKRIPFNDKEVVIEVLNG